MSKRVFNKWMKTYRTVTEVDFDNVDQWEDGDVEIAFIEGYWSGRRDSISWLINSISSLRGFKTELNKKFNYWQNRLDRALAMRGNREEIGGIQEERERLCNVQKKSKPNTMTQEVALCKYEVMTKNKKIEVMENALGLMESDNSQSYEKCIARGVSGVTGINLR